MSDNSRPAPTTLSDMQNMTTEQFKNVDKFLYHGDLSKRRVVRHIIELAEQELSWQGESNSNSLRDFWYNPTKAILEEAFPDAYGGPGTSKFNRNMSKVLSSVLSDMVKDGEITYRDLNILDDSRDREIHTRSVESDKILFVEKSSAYRKLKPLEEVYQLSLVEGSGWQATAAIEDLVRQLDTDEQEYTVYVLSDYDPAGFGIVEDFAARVEQFGLPVDDVKRIGINPEQVSQQALDEQKFTPGGSNIDDWLQTHGIDGQYGLELEAVGTDLEKKGRALRKLVVEEIKDDIDARTRRKQDTASKIESKGNSAAVSVANNITSDLEDALKSAAADIVQEAVAGVESASASRFGMSVSIDFDTIEAVHDGDIDPDDVDGDPTITPRPYPDDDLHKGAYKGRTPRVRDSNAMKKRVVNELQEQIKNGDIDVEQLLDL